MSRAGHLFCVVSGMSFGATAIFAKLAASAGANVGTLLTIRFSLAAACMWLLLAVRARDHREDLRPRSRRDLFAALTLGGVGYAGQSGCYFAALNHIGPGILSLLVYTYPAMVALVALAFGMERLEPARAGALVCALCGVALVVTGAADEGVSWVGVSLAIGAALFCAGYVLAAHDLTGRMPSALLAAFVCSGAAVSLGLVVGATGEFRPGELSLAAWGWTAALTMVSTVAAIAFLLEGVKRVGPTAASTLSTVEPATTLALTFVVFGERMTTGQVLGAALVLAAVTLLAASTAATSEPPLA